MLARFLYRQAKKRLGPHFSKASHNAIQKAEPITQWAKAHIASPASHKLAHAKAIAQHYAADYFGKTSDGKTGLTIFLEEFGHRYKSPKLSGAIKTSLITGVFVGGVTAFSQYQHHDTETVLPFPDQQDNSASVLASCYNDGWNENCIAFIRKPNADKDTGHDVALYRLDENIYTMSAPESAFARAWVHIADPQEALYLIAARNEAEQSTPVFVGEALDAPMVYNMEKAGWIARWLNNLGNQGYMPSVPIDFQGGGGFIHAAHAQDLSASRPVELSSVKRAPVIIRPNIGQKNWNPLVDISTFNVEGIKLNDTPVRDFQKEEWGNVAEIVAGATDQGQYGYSQQQIDVMPDSPATVALREGSNIGIPLGLAVYAMFNAMALSAGAVGALRQTRKRLEADPAMQMEMHL